MTENARLRLELDRVEREILAMPANRLTLDDIGRIRDLERRIAARSIADLEDAT
ncbi:MAG: hypothetical protein ACR2JC_11345 [Chloroflexota bacterium]